MKGVIFPGQGAQYAGMGKSLYDNFDEAKDTFNTIDGVVGFKLSDKCFFGAEQDLKDTSVQQLAILAVSVAAYRVFRAKAVWQDIAYVSGLSLGEYSCLYAADVLSLQDLAVLVKERAAAMQKAAAANPSTMFAVIGLSREELIKKQAQGRFFVANINSASQIAVSLKREDKEIVRDFLTAQGAGRIVELEVNGGFHSPFMAPAKEQLKAVIEQLDFHPASVPIVSNFTAQAACDPEVIKNNLWEQLVSAVLWNDCIEFMVGRGVDTFYEVGPSKVLKGILRKINPQVTVINIEKAQDLDSV